MRRALLIALSLFGALALTGCDMDYRSETEDRNLVIQEVVIDGKIVTCVVYDDEQYEQGGVSCDFD